MAVTVFVWAGVLFAFAIVITGAAASTVNAVTARGRLASVVLVLVTIIVQLSCIPSASVLNVIILLPEVAAVVALVQSPLYVIAPSSVVLNV